MTSLILLKSMLFTNALKRSHKKKKRKEMKKVVPIKKTTLKCRICTIEPGVVPIFEYNFLCPNIPEEIQNFSGVTLYESKNGSNHMCQSCFDLLNGCLMFRELCRRNNKVIQDTTVKTEKDTRTENEDKLDIENRQADSGSDDSYNVPSPILPGGNDNNSDAEFWACSMCNKQFESYDTYYVHASKCGKELVKEKKPPEKKRFLCDTCGKTSHSHATLLVHMLTHENVFPFKCELCPYQGRTPDLLKIHKRSHMADKPYKCTQCPKATTTSSNLAKHMRHVHSTARPYQCTYCDKSFSYQHDKNRHVRDIHLRQGTVECDVCFKKFNTKKILQGHRVKIHKIKSDRSGRLPSYLQCQQEEPNENNANDNNFNDNL